MTCKVQFLHCFIYSHTDAIHLWSYSTLNTLLATNLTIFYFWLLCVIFITLFAPLREVTTVMWLAKYNFCILHLPTHSDNVFTNWQHLNKSLASKLTILYFASYLVLLFALFAQLRGLNTNIWIVEYIYRQCIYNVTPFFYKQLTFRVQLRVA